MMPGIVSVLDEAHFGMVNDLWRELKARFGLSFLAAQFISPHFSYHVAEAYDVAAMLGVLEKLAEETAVFNLKTAGIGIFTSADPVIYIPVVTSPTLSTLHQTLWQQIAPYASQPQAYYAPDGWFPHVTLAQKDVTPDKLGDAISWLNQQPLYWTIEVNNFTFIDEVSSGNPKQHRFDFQG